MLRVSGAIAFIFVLVMTLGACASSSSSGIVLTVSRGDATSAYAGTDRSADAGTNSTANCLCCLAPQTGTRRRTQRALCARCVRR